MLQRLFIFLFVGKIVIIGMVYAVSYPNHTQQDPSPQHMALTGRVLDPSGQSVPRARVYAQRSEFAIGRLPNTITNEQGEFSFSDLVPGIYTVHADTEDEEYAPTYSSFHSAGFVQAPQVAIYEPPSTSYVEVYLGPRTAKLTGRIVDSVTNRPILGLQNIQITLKRVDQPDHLYATGPDVNGNFTIHVPPMPFTVEVSAPGYQRWQYRRDDSIRQPNTLQLASGQTRRLDIALRRIR